MERVLWRGVWLDRRTAAMMDEVVNLVAPIPIRPVQGSWSGAPTSAGTHTGSGAIDLDLWGFSRDWNETIEREMRRVGFFASIRPTIPGLWTIHMHAIAVGASGLAASAADQVRDYYAGRNGLANDGPDLGPRQFVGTTWEDYKEDPVITNADVDRIAEAAAAKVEPKIPTAADVARAVWTFVPRGRPDMFNPHRMLRWMFGKGEALEDYLTALPDDEQPPATDG